MIAVGKIVKPHGIRGDVKAECFMDSPDCFIKIKKVFVENEAAPYKVNKASVQKDAVLIHLQGVENMDDAEKFRGRTLFCEENDLPRPDKGRYYVTDIIGCSVYAGEQEYGKIVDILQYGSADVVVLKHRGVRRSFPWIKELCAEVNVQEKTFVVIEEKLKEVLLDED